MTRTTSASPSSSTWLTGFSLLAIGVLCVGGYLIGIRRPYLANWERAKALQAQGANLHMENLLPDAWLDKLPEGVVRRFDRISKVDFRFAGELRLAGDLDMRGCRHLRELGLVSDGQPSASGQPHAPRIDLSGCRQLRRLVIRKLDGCTFIGLEECLKIEELELIDVALDDLRLKALDQLKDLAMIRVISPNTLRLPATPLLERCILEESSVALPDFANASQLYSLRLKKMPTTHLRIGGQPRFLQFNDLGLQRLELADVSKLSHLVSIQNPLTTSELPFAAMTQLSDLVLAGYAKSELPPLDSLLALEVLDVSYSSLTSLPALPPNLHSLSAARVPIQSLPDRLLTNPRMQYLDLEGTRFEAGSFSRIPGIDVPDPAMHTPLKF